jgi:hypothetical protein
MALDYAKVNNSRAPGIGDRLDGWTNWGLNVVVIVDLAAEPCRVWGSNG